MPRPGFEPESITRKATMIGRTTLSGQKYFRQSLEKLLSFKSFLYYKKRILFKNLSKRYEKKEFCSRIIPLLRRFYCLITYFFFLTIIPATVATSIMEERVINKVKPGVSSVVPNPALAIYSLALSRSKLYLMMFGLHQIPIFG